MWPPPDLEDRLHAPNAHLPNASVGNTVLYRAHGGRPPPRRLPRPATNPAVPPPSTRSPPGQRAFLLFSSESPRVLAMPASRTSALSPRLPRLVARCGNTPLREADLFGAPSRLRQARTRCDPCPPHAPDPRAPPILSPRPRPTPTCRRPRVSAPRANARAKSRICQRRPP